MAVGASGPFNVIVVKTNGDPFYKEGRASSAIRPGMLIELGGAHDLRPHSTAAAAGPFMIRIADMNEEVGLVGAQYSRGIDDNYAVGDYVKYVVPKRGEEFYMLLEDEGNVAKGAALESAGDGTLQARTTGQVVAYAAEAVDNTGGTGPVRILVEAA